MTPPINEEEREPPVCFVFFVERRTRRLSLRVLIRRPDIAYRCLIVWMVATLSRSNITHVCFGDGRVVLDPSLEGARFYDGEAFVMFFPKLYRAAVVHTKVPIDLTRFEQLGPIKVLRTILRLLTGGRVGSNDCVSVTTKALRRAGITIPDDVVTPHQLLRWLERDGYEQIDMR